MSDFEDFKNQKQKAVKYSWRCTPRPRHVILRQSHSAPISARYSILRKRPEGPEKQKSAKHYQRIMARTASGKSIVGTTERLLCVLVWRGFPPSSSTLSPPPPSLGGADAHAAALSGPQNLHLTHGGRSAADNHPPAAAFDTHKLQKRRTEPEARKIQRTRTRTRMSYLSGIADAATLDQSLGRIPKSLPYISSSAWTDAVRRAERRVPSIWAILRLDLLIASFVQI